MNLLTLISTLLTIYSQLAQTLPLFPTTPQPDITSEYCCTSTCDSCHPFLPCGFGCLIPVRTSNILSPKCFESALQKNKKFSNIRVSVLFSHGSTAALYLSLQLEMRMELGWLRSILREIWLSLRVLRSKDGERNGNNIGLWTGLWATQWRDLDWDMDLEKMGVILCRNHGWIQKHQLTLEIKAMLYHLPMSILPVSNSKCSILLIQSTSPHILLLHHKANIHFSESGPKDD